MKRYKTSFFALAALVIVASVMSCNKDQRCVNKLTDKNWLVDQNITDATSGSVISSTSDSLRVSVKFEKYKLKDADFGLMIMNLDSLEYGNYDVYDTLEYKLSDDCSIFSFKGKTDLFFHEASISELTKKNFNYTWNQSIGNGVSWNYDVKLSNTAN